MPIDDDGATEIARRARGTPRIANRLLRRVRDFAAVERDGAIDGDDRRVVARSARGRSRRASTRSTARTSSVICERFDGGPVGIEAVAASLSEERGTLEEVVEPFLLQVGFIARTPRGRVATAAGFQHMGLAAPSKAPTGGGWRLRAPGGSAGPAVLAGSRPGGDRARRERAVEDVGGGAAHEHVR